MSSVIDLTKLPPPQVVEQLNYEQIFAANLADFLAENPEYDALVESDPAYKILQAAAYVEVGLRKRINSAAVAVMLAFAKGTDADNLTAFADVERLTIVPAAPDAIPPQPAIMESDADLIYRYQLAWDTLSVAGPDGAYEYFARTAHAGVKDASVQSITAGEVIVTLLGLDGESAVDPAIIAAVESVLRDESVRPLTDSVIVQSATIINYEIIAQIYVLPGPDSTVVLDAANAAMDKYIIATNKIGADVTLSGLYAALHQPGVQRVELESPTETLAITKGQASFCTNKQITFGGRAE